MKKLLLIIKKILKKIWTFFKLLILSIISLGVKENQAKKTINPKKEEIKTEKSTETTNSESEYPTVKILEKKEKPKKKDENLFQEAKNQEQLSEDEKILEAVKKELKKKNRVIEEKEIEEKLIPKIKETMKKKDIRKEAEWQEEIKKSVADYLEEKDKKLQENQEIKQEKTISIEDDLKEKQVAESPKIETSEPIQDISKINNKSVNSFDEIAKEAMIYPYQDKALSKISVEEITNQREEETDVEYLEEQPNSLRQDNANHEVKKELIESLVTKEIENKFFETEELIHLKKEELQTLKSEIKKSHNSDKPVKKETEKQPVLKDVTPALKNLEIEIKTVLQATEKELQKETLEEKEYPIVETQLNYLLNKIEEIKIKYKESLTPMQREKLNQEEGKIKTAKRALNQQLEGFIEKESKVLEEIIPEETKTNLQKELEKMHLENNIEISKILLGDIENLNNKTQQQIAMIEKQLIKSKLKKASKSLEVPLLLSLPFVRNKYFFYFTTSLFASNHLAFLKNIFKRKKVEYTPINFTSLQKGQDALIGAIGLTLDNIKKLESLEKEILIKYPELVNDPEFLASLTDLKGKLYNNYNSLAKKQETIMKYNFQSKKYMRKLKRNKY